MEHTQPSRLRQVIWLFGFVAICLAAAGVGAAITATTVDNWYETLARPSWTPPDWLFGPVWTTLYILMAVAAWLVWRRGGWSSSRVPLCLFALQLGLNVGWSASFFGLRNPGLAFIEILILWVAIAATTVSFFRRSTLAAVLLMPYWAWTTFAAFLNFSIWRMNP